MITQALALLSGAALSGAFGFPKPYCYVSAVVSAVAVILFRVRV
jgi:hypothetical protein